MSHLQTKIGDTNLRTLSQWTQKGDKEFYNRHFIYRKKRLGLQRNLIFNQGIKNIWIFEVVVVVEGGVGGEKCVYLWKNPGYAPD